MKKNKKNPTYEKYAELLTQDEREAWKLPERITVSQWADKNRVLDPMMSAEPGPWSTDRTPYLREPMDSFTNPLVEEITLMFSTQVGKTECGFNCLGYAIDQDPGPTLYVMPRIDDCRSVSANRIKPMIDLAPSLRAKKTKLTDDFSKLEYRLKNMLVFFAGAESPAALSGKPIRYLLMDELDKYPKFSGKEADPVKLATERTRTFLDRRKIIKYSTPTTKEGYIYREYDRSDKRKFYLPCPHCGEYQVLYWGNVRFPQGIRDPKELETQRVAFYECIQCHKKIEDRHKPRMLRLGVWAPEGCGVDRTGKITGENRETGHRGYWINCLYSPWLTFSDIAAEWLRAHPYVETLMNFVNSWLAEPWEETTHVNETNEVRAHCEGHYGKGIVPKGGQVLTAGVDVQQDCFYLVVRAWGYQQQSWLVRASRVELWEDVINALFTEHYKKEGGGTMPVMLACIDSGYRTDEVYEVCARHAERAKAIKGRDHLNGKPYTNSQILKNPKTGKPIPGGINIWHLATNYFKDKIQRFVTAAVGDPGRWNLYGEVEEDYLKQFCAEQKVKERNRKTGQVIELWKPKTAGAANHYKDCEVYAAAAAELLRLQWLPPLDKAQGDQEVYEPREGGGGFIRKFAPGGPGGKWIRR